MRSIYAPGRSHGKTEDRRPNTEHHITNTEYRIVNHSPWCPFFGFPHFIRDRLFLSTKGGHSGKQRNEQNIIMKKVRKKKSNSAPILGPQAHGRAYAFITASISNAALFKNALMLISDISVTL